MLNCSASEEQTLGVHVMDGMMAWDMLLHQNNFINEELSLLGVLWEDGSLL